MRISDVLADLQPDFPTLSPSKLRFLEEQGLVEPRRSPGGYRQYSRADVERVRYVLAQQRDRYLPLRVIGEQLAALDRGEVTEAVTPRLATSDGERASLRSAGRHTVASLAEEAGADVTLVAGLAEAGVISAGTGGHFEPWTLEVVRAAAGLAEHGVEPRHLRGFRTAADRQVAVVEQIVAPLRGQRAVAAQAHAASVAAEVGELCARLHTALVRAGVADLAP
ncbi:MerR family transcriptional regulator [Isoptericola sp. b441]|uniref:MerR family transcriptional regulator n=1 Tax=Actinotalea lenta TaxID=3064654 RepID=A0ABT9DB59_9CELL|nr:MerR family transcriptional regulator [Isoptericola sp. b441]MDO8107736.1 MerR family transcriptional regulator [Isoptericola sp. b441]